MIKTKKQFYLISFFLAAIVALILLVPFIIGDNGYMVYFGDYNMQPIPFIKTCVNAIHNGNFGWNWYSDMGVNFIATYSNYLGSPFFWIFTLFPADISHYLMMPVMVLKISLMSLMAAIYIKRFVKSYDTALIGGLLYAFSGYSIYSIVYYQFHDSLAFFPLLLIALEEAVINKRRGVFALTVALKALISYSGFISECIFLVIYFVARICCSEEFRINIKDFLCLAFESIAGVMLAAIIFVPSVVQTLELPRITDILTGSDLMFYTPSERYGLILQALFFPPELPAYNTLFKDANSYWTNLTFYIPFISMAGIFAFMKARKKHWASVILKVCAVFLAVPALNAIFLMMNEKFYTRWLYMPYLIGCMATAAALENEEEFNIKKGHIISSAATIIISLVVLLHPVYFNYLKVNEKGEKYYEQSIAPAFMDKFDTVAYLIIGAAILSIIVFSIFLKNRKKAGQEKFMSNILAGIMLFSLLTGFIHMGPARLKGPVFGDMEKRINKNLEIEDENFYRIEVMGNIFNNTTMLWGEASHQSFQTIVPKSIFDIYEKMGKKRINYSQSISGNYAFRSYIGVKYMLYASEGILNTAENSDIDENFEYYKTSAGYDIYINKYSMPMGFTYDEYVNDEVVDLLLPEEEEAEKNENAETSAEEEEKNNTVYTDDLMMGAVILSDEQIEKYSDLLKPVDESKTTEDSFNFERYEEEVQKRIESGVKSYKVLENGNFTIETDYSEEELLVTNVPYDKGWSASVNGKPVQIDCVNVGFMAIRIPEGENNIEFTYAAPGLKAGIILSASAALLITGYFIYHYKIKKKEEKESV